MNEERTWKCLPKMKHTWSFVIQIFHNGQPSHGGDRKTCDEYEHLCSILHILTTCTSFFFFFVFVDFSHIIVCSDSVLIFIQRTYFEPQFIKYYIKSDMQSDISQPMIDFQVFFNDIVGHFFPFSPLMPVRVQNQISDARCFFFSK